ncbi:MAG: TonB-dependent receptor [Acidobacteriota bacterium]
MNSSRSFRTLILTLGALTLLGGLALAQTTLGRIVGTVRDPTGAVVPGAKVTVTNELTGQQIASATTSSEGGFVVPQLTNGSYSVKIELKGFKTASYTEVKVDPGQDYSLTAQVEVGETSEVVQVTAGTDLVHTSSPEISNTVSRRQIVDLPLNGRNPIDLIRLQAGVVGLPTRTNTTINGGRPTWTQLTQDGINIQDNFIRVNSLDFVPNRPTSDTIGEFTITTNTQGADAAGGSSQVKLVTPSGASDFHGSLYEFNRNSALSGNSWFNNRTVSTLTGKTIPRPFLNRNQFGGNLSGPILVPRKVFGPLGGWNDNKDKLFFFFAYESFRQRTQTTQNNTIPAYNDLVDGVFRYVRPSDGTVQTINVINQLPGLSLDPRVRSDLLKGIPSASLANNFDVGNSSATRLLNTAGYRFNQSDKNDRDQYSMRFDYQATLNHRFEFIHTRLRETDDRTDLDLVNLRPKVFTDSTVKLIVGAWRWTASPRLNNELRIGVNLAPVAFNSIENFSGLSYGLPVGVTLREVAFQPQGRDTRTRQYIDNASYVTGNHSLQFGGSLQQIRVQPYNFANRFQVLNFGFSAAAPAAVQLTAANFPGSSIAAADLANANALRSFLAGVYTSTSQTYFVKDQTTGFVGGIPQVNNYNLNNYAFYLQDSWRIRPNLTLRYGLKWEYFSPLTESDNLQLLPVVTGSTRDALLNPNGVVDFVKGGFYDKDRNNFGPTVGLAWDPFKDGKTSIRAGYTMAFVNEETITVARNAGVGNAGLTTTAANTAPLYGFFNAGLPGIPTPTFKVPRTYADQIGLSLTSAAFGIDKNIKQPYVHQISVSVEREIGWDLAVEARYVATLGRDIWQGVDLNQVDPLKNADFLADFKRAQSNGFLSLASTGVFNPVFNAAITGSQNLTIIPNFGGGALTNATVRTAIQQGEVGRLADFYLASSGAAVATQSRAFFYGGGGNPGVYAADNIENGGKTDYHALQLEARRRFKSGIFGQVNYTFSKVLSNSTGTAQSRFEPFIDNNRRGLERTRADFDVTHVLNASVIVELPFGSGRKFLSGGGVMDRIVGGWQVTSIIHAQSGAPISILSGRGSFNRAGRSAGNPADSTLSSSQIKELFGIRKLADGRVYFIDPKVIDPTTGRGVGADVAGNVASFPGQVFFNPNAGTIGSLQRLQFDGPSQTSWDFGLKKSTRIKESTNIELRVDFFNFLNHPLFFVGDANVNSATFGRITGLNFGARVVQAALKLNF